MWVLGANLWGLYNYHDDRAYGYKRSGILPSLIEFGLVG
jgi:hypothetical protein